MSREPKSPPEKKQLEYTRDHFTPGWNSSRGFPQVWKRKKTQANRQYRRNSEELLAQAKPGIAGEDVDLIGDDLTAARFQKSVTRKRLRKIGTVTAGQKVKDKLARRQDAIGRNVRRHQQFDEAARAAVHTLCSLNDEDVVAVVHRADWLCNRRNEDERKRVCRSPAAIDRALHFLRQVSVGSSFEIDALGRNPELAKAFAAWQQNAERILASEQRKRERKQNEKDATRKKLKALSSR